MDVAKLEAAIGTKPVHAGQSPAQMRQTVRAFLDSHKDTEKEKLKDATDRISKIIAELRKVEGLEPEVSY